MKQHRFIGKFNIVPGIFKISDFELVNQIRNVLKLKVGEKVILCDGNNKEGVAEIKGYGKNLVEVEIQEISVNQNEPERNVVLYCSILKKENFELVVQKATEIGVKEIVPIITARTVKLDIRKDRLEKIIKEAAEQSGRGVVPVLYDPVNFQEAIKLSEDNDVKIIFDQFGKTDLRSQLQATSYKLLAIFVGPEGGWTPEELQTARDAGFEIVSLGKTTLRAETAAIIGTYLAVHK
ncbi:MAG: hypothetical protein A3B86_03535 [Candidatus Yanofskybacteria bacterium RIFCSPHIGHO2_02_FULL_38_22b]|uniref:Ribosomal RNA small subunit methyltransferase E n=1 Tax=Candidatus Yanofskybacteria bacterium RIFCSPHIGHO2_02_FULL_38_22b TaxID=1802673 RepID=A0A1F8F030_9BACT|nr:MAG: hypothetical protein A3B86_03535 [Candidatus Yanofskybacteria bacterium RIFCSPHIGHO2_02_FULL_38_22b]OGN19457.1 MAG: hypothetical protein A2910_02915 [Candidatus Yanofskybacteria bacterium RIFCSPLOWO2_01_FULL_39_28]